MPWCPKCRSEYREGFTKCNDCDVDLVDELPPEPAEEEEKPEFVEFEDEVVLETFEDNIEFMYVASMLDEMDIPYRVRTKGGASIKGIYTHNAHIQKTIYVDDKDYEKAEEVLDSLDAYLLENVDDAYDEEGEEDYDTYVDHGDYEE